MNASLGVQTAREHGCYHKKKDEDRNLTSHGMVWRSLKPCSWWGARSITADFGRRSYQFVVS
jgi:hypothetical protein